VNKYEDESMHQRMRSSSRADRLAVMEQFWHSMAKESAEPLKEKYRPERTWGTKMK
jgi:hypothetical protein